MCAKEVGVLGGPWVLHTIALRDVLTAHERQRSTRFSTFSPGPFVDAPGARRYCRQDMKIPYSCLLLVTGLMLLSACFRPDRRSLTVVVPQMKSQDCANRVVASFKQGSAGAVEGIHTVTPNLQARTVTVEFDPQKLGFKNIEVTIASAGFDANDVLANAEAKAKLPPECR